MCSIVLITQQFFRNSHERCNFRHCCGSLAFHLNAEAITIMETLGLSDKQLKRIKAFVTDAILDRQGMNVRLEKLYQDFDLR